ncbi:hypothetical protein [Geminisphaera colitermitum]|uniref:hypothetical protein n=1 Tax=Geminisphaera colitermitum TaxID=1148786 RepID=UPI000158CDBB|nr:hypothetical protein [Geminisphaera colitermitum]
MTAALTTAEAGGTPAPHAEKLNPITFAVAVLKLRIYSWQAKIMASVWSGKPTVAATPNGAGKTSVIIVALALTLLHEFPGATVVLTSATYRAVCDQIFASLAVHQAKFSAWKWNDTEINDGQGGRIIGFATDRGGRFEGFHAYPGRPLLIILDEAKSIADDIFVAADRCQPTMLLYISSWGGLFGRFHDAFSQDRFAQFQAGIADCPHITPEFIEAMRAQYGEDSDIYRSMILGQRPKGNETGFVVPFVDYERCESNPPVWQEGTKQVFCDFAETSDECVIAKRDGNRLSIVDAWIPDGNTAGITDRFEGHLRRLQNEGFVIRGDADGTGHGYITALSLRGIKISGVKNNDAPMDNHYFNLAAEHWWTFAKKVKSNFWILPHDEVLKRQLCSREEVYRKVGDKKVYGREDGRLQLMPKSRLSTKSPDRADALVGAAFDYASFAAFTLMGGNDMRSHLDMLNEALGYGPNAGTIEGACAG